MILANRIKQSRIKNNYSQKTLSKIMNVTVATISFWENGKKIPSMKHLDKLSKILGVKIDYLFGNDIYVSDEEETYKVLMSKEDIEIIIKLKEYEKLYNKILENPTRAFERITTKFF